MVSTRFERDGVSREPKRLPCHETLCDWVPPFCRSTPSFRFNGHSTDEPEHKLSRKDETAWDPSRQEQDPIKGFETKYRTSTNWVSSSKPSNEEKETPLRYCFVSSVA
mmetsp:Transcript_24158/g.56992  ORF Transcript_24158/g.56992 Transcript_24158/m.56992 type:complete len:108 (+) Transcript_24158:168-491(+)